MTSGSLNALQLPQLPKALRSTPRMERHSAKYNTTTPIITNEAAAAVVGVRPPNARASAKTWKRAWLFFGSVLPLLHAFDEYKPPDSSLALHCLWWKALSANDRQSPVYDQGWAYDLLPRGTRILTKFRKFFPRLHHANVEIRTAFLDQTVTALSEQYQETHQIRLVTLGGGYDVRSLKLRERGVIQESVELDLPSVVEAKQALFSSRRFQRRRPHAALPKLQPIDLNNLEQTKNILQSILQQSKTDIGKPWHTIFLFEGVMIYLDEGIPSGLLNVTSTVLKDSHASGSLVFADRLENIPGCDEAAGRIEMARNGWKLDRWLPKPGLARHMGSADLLDV